MKKYEVRPLKKSAKIGNEKRERKAQRKQ